MPNVQQRTERAQRARANGAKSRGPKTAAFLPFHAKLLAGWQPKTSEAELLVNQLITVIWDTRLLQFGYTLYMSELAATSPYADDPVKLNIEAQMLAAARLPVARLASKQVPLQADRPRSR